MDLAPRAPVPPVKTAARTATPRHRATLLMTLVGLGILLLLGWAAMTHRRTKSTQARQGTEGVSLAQRRAGEIPQAASILVAPLRAPASTLPASPTPLPMPETQQAHLKPGPRYIIHDSVPLRPAPGHVFVDTLPGSTVWIDGEAKGKTPIDVLVGSGSKKLRLEATGFRPVHETFEADRGATIRRALVPLDAPP